MTDSTRDITITENISIIMLICYGKEDKAKEKLMATAKCDHLDATSLAEVKLRNLHDVGLDPRNITCYIMCYLSVMVMVLS